MYIFVKSILLSKFIMLWVFKFLINFLIIINIFKYRKVWTHTYKRTKLEQRKCKKCFTLFLFSRRTNKNCQEISHFVRKNILTEKRKKKNIALYSLKLMSHTILFSYNIVIKRYFWAIDAYRPR